MARVHLLDDELINKIAAGEVVERPASVVKELVENAIDAGATHVKVILKDGGRQLIQVQDDGCGMAPEDAVMAVRRHTTSKLQAADDLFAVKTMGFRGEALASIASVSRFTLQTQSREHPGHRVHIEDGKQTDSPWQGSPGTCMTVADLFYNVPARRAFLKTSAAEFAACHEYMQALALSLPTVGFTLLHNDREVFSVSPALKTEGYLRGEASMRARASALIGPEEAARLIYLHRPDRHAHVEALISPPGLDKGTARHCFTFVNGRWVRDKLLRFALQRGYHSHLMKGKFPIALLYVTIDPALVDVNVHPAKAELRFQYAQEVQNALVYAIREALRDGSWASANPPVKTVDSSPVVTPDDFDIALPQEEEVKRTVMRFDAETPAATPPKTRVQPSLNFTKDEPVRSGARSAMPSSPAPAPERSTFEARPRATVDNVATSSLRTAPAETNRTPAFDRPVPAAKASPAVPVENEVIRKGADSGATREAGAEASSLSNATTKPSASVKAHETGTMASGSESVSAPAKAQAKDAEVSASVQASAPAKTQEAEGMASISARTSAPASSLSQTTHVSPATMPGDKGVASTLPGASLASASTLRTLSPDAKMNARPAASTSPSVKASVPSPDGQTSIPWSELQYIGPFARCFLLFEYQQQMLAIDQHAFHERVLYERLVENPDILRRTQPLLMPEVLVFSPTETERLVHMKDALDALGIQIQGVSDTEIEVTSVPSLLVNKDLNSLLAAILGGRDKPSELAHDVLATMACHAAVRAGEELPEPELKALLREAESVDFYHNCPHGRRVFRWWKLAQVASWFDR
jgi:DNA mismatch repair protein MutL